MKKFLIASLLVVGFMGCTFAVEIKSNFLYALVLQVLTEWEISPDQMVTVLQNCEKKNKKLGKQCWEVVTMMTVDTEKKAEEENKTKEELKAEVKEEVKAEVREQVTAEVKDEIKEQVKAELKAEEEAEAERKRLEEEEVERLRQEELQKNYDAAMKSYQECTRTHQNPFPNNPYYHYISPCSFPILW